MSLLVINNQIHIIGIIDEYVVEPFISNFNNISKNHSSIEIHLSGEKTETYIEPIIECLRNSKIDINVYVHNALTHGGYNGIGGDFFNFLNFAKRIYVDNGIVLSGYTYETNNSIYNPPMESIVEEVCCTRQRCKTECCSGDFYSCGGSNVVI